LIEVKESHIKRDTKGDFDEGLAKGFENRHSIIMSFISAQHTGFYYGGVKSRP
jgi:hypothetical protein